MGWQKDYLARFYNPAKGWTDGTSEFHELCRRYIRPSGRILEVGAGATNPTSEFLATLGELHGIDPDPHVLKNQALAHGAVLDGDAYPYPGEHFDACVTNYVCEHLADPLGHLREVRRVLRPGGVYILRTPNWFHYTSLISSATPHWVHSLLSSRLRNISCEEHELFPTHYRLNTSAALRRMATEAALLPEHVRMVEKEPSYGMSARPLFLLFMTYERVLNSTEYLRGLRANLFAVLRRP